ncbi:MAG: hypothetical protein ABIQ12_11945 [Opitutaceae bacterium]
MKHSIASKSTAAMRALRLASVAAAVFTLAHFASAQNGAAPTDPNGGRRRGGGTPGGQDAGGRGNFSPEDMQARMLTSLRERLGVTSDEEWTLISNKLNAVTELRRASGGAGGGGFAFGGGRGGPPGGAPGGGGDTSGRGGRSGRGGSNPELAALQAAVTDNLPEAEIKSRLERVRETRRDNEAKLLKAQEDLRALLSVKQEAVAVMFGLLP